jgi:hypothetical protein
MRFQTVAQETIMALVIKRTSSWWYALFKSNGRRQAINLKVKIEGSRPASVGDAGDDAFERSRGKATKPTTGF